MQRLSVLPDGCHVVGRAFDFLRSAYTPELQSQHVGRGPVAASGSSHHINHPLDIQSAYAGAYAPTSDGEYALAVAGASADPFPDAGHSTHDPRAWATHGTFSQSMPDLHSLPDLMAEQSPSMQPMHHFQLPAGMQQYEHQPHQRHQAPSHVVSHVSHSYGTPVPDNKAGFSGTHRLPAHNPYVGTFPRAPSGVARVTNGPGTKRPSPSSESGGKEDLARCLRQVRVEY